MANKTLYHSELTKRGETIALVKSEVTPSKYEGKPPFVVLEIDGAERLYNCENAACEGKLMLRRGQVLKLRATGSRDSADIEILDGDNGDNGDTPLPPPAQKPPTVRSTSVPHPLDRPSGLPLEGSINAAVDRAAAVTAKAWDKASELMTTIPAADAKEMGLDTWYRIRCHFCKDINIYAQKELNR